MTTTTDKRKILDELSQHCGTGNYYRHALTRRLLFTDGIFDMADRLGAYWLVDLVASYVATRDLPAMTFWELRRLSPDAVNDAVIEAREDTGRPCIVRQLIPFTDFPVEVDETFSVWLQSTGDGRYVLMLPSEY